VTPGSPHSAFGSLEIRRLDLPEEFRAVEEVQRVAWGLGNESAVPAALQRAFQDNGGLVLGAFVRSRMVGFSLGFLGREGSSTFLYSHMTAVRPEYQDHRVGFALKLAQRREARAMSLPEVRWTFDPLQSKNAHFNVHRLGGEPDRYFPGYYGAMNDSINAGLETDRVRLVWSLDSARVRRRLRAKPGGKPAGGRISDDSAPLLRTERGARGLRRPVEALPPSGPRVNLEIPFDLSAVRRLGPVAVRRWRRFTRVAFEAALSGGYRVEDFVVERREGEARSFYLLALHVRED
jgi:chorismate synthase